MNRRKYLFVKFSKLFQDRIFQKMTKSCCKTKQIVSDNVKSDYNLNVFLKIEYHPDKMFYNTAS